MGSRGPSLEGEYPHCVLPHGLATDSRASGMRASGRWTATQLSRRAAHREGLPLPDNATSCRRSSVFEGPFQFVNIFSDEVYFQVLTKLI